MALNDFARVLGGQVVERARMEAAPVLAAVKGVWLPVVVVGEAGPLKTVATTIGPDEVIDAFVDKPLADLKASKVAAAAVKRDAVFAGGFTVTGGTLDGAVLACRNVEDRTNWLTLQNLCAAQIAGGQGATVGAPFRTLANVNFTLSFEEAFGVLVALSLWGSAIYAREWAIKDAALAAEDKAALDAVDGDAGWPG